MLCNVRDFCVDNDYIYVIPLLKYREIGEDTFIM